MQTEISYEGSIHNWKKQRHGNLPPYRHEIGNPEPNCQFILRMTQQNEVKIRRVGLYFERLFGGLLQGRKFTSLFVGEDVDILKRNIARVFLEPAIAFVHFESCGTAYRLAILPLRAPHGIINEALGVTNLEEMPLASEPVAHYLTSDIMSMRREEGEVNFNLAESKKGFTHQKSNFQVIQGGGGKSNLPPQKNFGIISNIKKEP